MKFILALIIGLSFVGSAWANDLTMWRIKQREAAITIALNASAHQKYLAQFVPMPGMATPKQSGGGGGYTGACDGLAGFSCTDGGGALRLTNAYTGKLVHACLYVSTTSVCGSGGNTAADIGYDATTGGLNASDLSSLGCTTDSGIGTSCVADKIYSQFGGCTFTTGSDITAMPTIRVVTTQNGLPNLYNPTQQSGGAGTTSLTCSVSLSVTSATLISIVTDANTAIAAALGIYTSGGNIFSDYNNSVNKERALQPSVQGSSGITQISAIHSFVSQVSGSTLQAVIGGTADTSGGSLSFTSITSLQYSNEAGTGNWTGQNNSWVIIAPGTSNANAATVVAALCTKWKGSAC